MSFFQSVRETAVRKIVDKLQGCALVEVRLVSPTETKRVLSFEPCNYLSFITLAPQLKLQITLHRASDGTLGPEEIIVGLK